MSWKPHPAPRASRPVFLWRARCPDRLRLPLLRSFPRLERGRVARERVALAGRPSHGGPGGPRSGGRRVGEKGRSRGAPDHLKKKKKKPNSAGVNQDGTDQHTTARAELEQRRSTKGQRTHENGEMHTQAQNIAPERA